MVYDISFIAVSTVNESWERVRRIPNYHEIAGVALFRR
jgi:hypothetical protein